MKIIHCADLHIGSKMDSKYPAQKAKLRRQELRNAFANMVDEGNNLNVDAILISGDAFDSDHPSEKDLEYFYGVIAAHPNISFFYLRGNHDIDGYRPNQALNNLFTFSSEKWTTYTFEKEKVTISGIEINKENLQSFYDAEGLQTDPGCYNIAMLHGQVGNDIHLTKLAHKNLDYIALGHVHSQKLYQMEDGGIAVYSGILEPRGFDEIGEKGFIFVDTTERKRYFQPFCTRHVIWTQLDITGLKSEYEISTAVKELIKNRDDIYRVELIGRIDKSIRYEPNNIVARCQSSCFLLDILDSSKPLVPNKDIKQDSPLIKEFIAKTQEEKDLSEEEKSEVIQLGLKALAGKEF